MVDGFDTLSRMKSIVEPVWSLHGKEDDTIPFFMSEELQAAAGMPKGLWALDDAGHNNVRSVAGEEYSKWLKEIAEECVAGKPESRP